MAMQLAGCNDNSDGCCEGRGRATAGFGQQQCCACKLDEIEQGAFHSHTVHISVSSSVSRPACSAMWPMRAITAPIPPGHTVSAQQLLHRIFTDLMHRNIWSEAQQATPPASTPTLDSFYDNTVEEVRSQPHMPSASTIPTSQYAQQPIEQLTLGQMLDFGRDVTFKHDKILTSARYVHREVRRL